MYRNVYTHTPILKVVQAVKMYKSLTGFVSTTLLSRLTMKEIWTKPLLHSLCGDRQACQLSGAATAPERSTTGNCDQTAAPASPTARICPRGGNTARAAVYLEIIGGDGPQPSGSVPTPTSAPWDASAEFAVHRTRTCTRHSRADAIIVYSMMLVGWDLYIAMRRLDVPMYHLCLSSFC